MKEKILILPTGVEPMTFRLIQCTSDALPLIYRRLVGARLLNYVHVTNILHTARTEMLMSCCCTMMKK